MTFNPARRDVLKGFAAATGLGLAARAGAAPAREMPDMATTKPRTPVAVLHYDNPILFDYGPSEEIFRVADGFAAFDVFSVAVSTDPIPNRFFPTELHPRYSFATAPKPTVLIIGGGDWSLVDQRARQGDARIYDYVRACLAGGTTVLGICTGTYILANGGLLDGRTATSLPVEIARFRKAAPNAIVREDMPFVDDGNIVTASGAFTGIDAALHLLRRIKGEPVARFVANTYMDYRHWDPTFDGRPTPRRAT